VEGTRRLLTALQDFDVEQFIFSSSLLVMQPAEEGEKVSETSPVEASWDYPESKIKAEKVIRAARGRIPVVILRIAGVYDEDCHSVPIAQQISRIHQRELESYFFPGDAGHGQAFVHLDDLVAGFIKTIERRAQLSEYEVLLIAEPDVMSYAELQERIGELLHGEEWPTIRIPKALAKAGAWVQDKLAGEDEPTFIKPWMVDLADQHYPVEISRARERLGWAPAHRLRDTLDEIVRRLKRDPARWYRENGLPPPERA
jgi:nucleoside-diphosphate-sugar epimerase